MAGAVLAGFLTALHLTGTTTDRLPVAAENCKRTATVACGEWNPVEVVPDDPRIQLLPEGGMAPQPKPKVMNGCRYERWALGLCKP
jgi:hypothetical protein